MRAPENIAAVAKSVCEAPTTSIHRCPQQLNILETSWRRILHKHLGMTPYKVQKLSFQMKFILILAGMLTYKIVAFEAQNTRTHILKSRRTQNESQFSADFGPEA